MRKLVMTALLLSGVCASYALTNDDDSDTLKMQELHEVVVQGIRLQKNAPFAVANIKKKELQEFAKTSRELPFLFTLTPNVIAWSDNGVGTGTSYLRIRGAGDSRINVTIDGVALNSPEDQCVFWANMNSYANILEQAQIQRGVGSSTNGDGAFGGTVVLQSAAPSEQSFLELTGSYGSYNTLKVGAQFSTGSFKFGTGRMIFNGAYNQTTTDGYLHGTSGRSGNYFGGLTWIKNDLIVSYKNIGNFEKTGQAWNGVTAGTNDLSIMDGTYGEHTGIKTYQDMLDAGLGKYNSLYEALTINDNGTYTTSRYKMADGSFWDKTTDNFWQNHSLLNISGKFANHWTATATLHYTHGYGYYSEFRPNNKLSKFGFSNFTDSDGKTVKRTDFVRKKGLMQDVAGLLGNVNYKDEHWDVIGGLYAQKFWGEHFGYVTYIAHPELNRYGTGKKYYDSDAAKVDVNTYIKTTYNISNLWNIFVDLQYRHVDYKTNGINDKFYDDEAGRYFNQELNINEHYNFFNPKAGFNFHTDSGHRFYGSLSICHREPERNNFTDNGSYPAPKAESVFDYELGYSYTRSNWRAGANLYYMDYSNQFVQTGAVSDIGENLTTNIKDSYRTGVEVTGGWDITPWLTVEGNAAISANKIKDFDEVVEDWDNGSQTIHYDNSTLAFSPSLILNGFINFHWKGFQAVWHTGYVGRQYLDNTECKDRSLPGYSLSELNISYPLTNLIKKKTLFKEVLIGVNMSNLFNQHVAQYGWVYSAICDSYGHPNSNRYYQIGFTPTAGFTSMANLTIRF